MDNRNPLIEIHGTILSNRASDSERSTCLEDFKKALKSVHGTDIDVSIDSPGGDLQAGLAIYEALKAIPAKVHVIVEGLACSAASVVMCAGDDISLYEDSIVMIHNSWFKIPAQAKIKREDVSYMAEVMDENDLTMARIYAMRTGKDITEIQADMEKETVLRGQEAVDYGLCTSLITDGKLINTFTKAEVIAMSTKTKKELEQAAETEAVKEPVKDEKKPEPKPAKEPAKSDVAIADKAQAEIDELKAEIERFKKLDELMAKVDIDLETINKAKYETKMTAEELSMQVLIERSSKAQANDTSGSMDHINDMLESGTKDVPSNPLDPSVQAKANTGFDWKSIAKVMDENK